MLWSSAAGGRGVLVAGTQPPDVVELWEWTLGPADHYASDAHTPGTRELVQVQRGTVTIMAGEQTVTLKVGDAAAYAGDVPHSSTNPRSRPARFTLTVLEPGVGAGATRPEAPDD